MVSSVSGKVALVTGGASGIGAALASYTATKHAVVALSRTLRVEAERHGIRVSVLCPGVIRTPILTGGKYGRINMPGLSSEDYLKYWEQLRPMAPEKFAERVIRAVLRGDDIIIVPARWKAWWYLERISPALSLRLARVMLRRVRQTESTAARSELPPQT